MITWYYFNSWDILDIAFVIIHFPQFLGWVLKMYTSYRKTANNCYGGDKPQFTFACIIYCMFFYSRTLLFRCPTGRENKFEIVGFLKNRVIIRWWSSKGKSISLTSEEQGFQITQVQTHEVWLYFRTGADNTCITILHKSFNPYFSNCWETTLPANNACSHALLLSVSTGKDILLMPSVSYICGWCFNPFTPSSKCRVQKEHFERWPWYIHLSSQ